MDPGHFYMQNGIVHARSFRISIGEYFDGHFNRTMHCDIMPLCLDYIKVSSFRPFIIMMHFNCIKHYILAESFLIVYVLF